MNVYAKMITGVGAVLATVSVFVKDAIYGEILVAMAIPLNVLVVVFSARSRMSNEVAGIFCLVSFLCAVAAYAHFSGSFSLLGRLLPLLVNLPPIFLTLLKSAEGGLRNASNKQT